MVSHNGDPFVAYHFFKDEKILALMNENGIGNFQKDSLFFISLKLKKEAELHILLFQVLVKVKPYNIQAIYVLDHIEMLIFKPQSYILF